jgi:chromosomal replication initiator protein
MNVQLIFAGYEQHMRSPVPSVADIKREVAHFFRIPAAEMVSQRRARDVARPRQVAMYLAKHRTPKSLPNIGKLFGNRDHSTVIHAVRTVERLIGEDLSIAEAVRTLEGRL